MNAASLKHFSIFFNRYYWQTTILIAQNGIARQYRNSFLGMLWTLFQPLTMVFIYTLILPFIMKRPVDNYPLYMMVSIPTWGLFSSTLIASSQSLLANGETLKRCMISSTVFPVADVLRCVYTFCISFTTMYFSCILFFAPISPLLLLLPLFLLPILMILGSMCIAIAFLAPYVRDLHDLVLVGLNMMFWLTPVVYSFESLPLNVQHFMQWNPFFIMLQPIQMIAYAQQLPGPEQVLRLFALTLVAIAVGFGIFSSCRRNYVYYL